MVGGRGVGDVALHSLGTICLYRKVLSRSLVIAKLDRPTAHRQRPGRSQCVRMLAVR